MFSHSPNSQVRSHWDAIERALAAQTRAQELREDAERICYDARTLRAESRQLRSSRWKACHEETADVGVTSALAANVEKN
jgi:hypothetical protein